MAADANTEADGVSSVEINSGNSIASSDAPVGMCQTVSLHDAALVRF